MEKDDKKVVNDSKKIAADCLEEIQEVLKKHNCALDIEYLNDVALGKKVIYGTVVVKPKKDGSN